MKSWALAAALLALVSTCQSQFDGIDYLDATVMEGFHRRELQAAPRLTDACRVPFRKLLGDPYNTTNVFSTERDCFGSCFVRSNSWYSWNLQEKICSCFQRANITGVEASPRPSTAPLLNYYVYGHLTKCFPYCSIAIPTCKICKAKRAANFSCTENFSRKRCCCYPPALPIVRRGRLSGCNEPPAPQNRMAMEIRRQTLESLDPETRALISADMPYMSESIGYAGWPLGDFEDNFLN